MCVDNEFRDRPARDVFYPYIYKRSLFDYEKEFRLICAHTFTHDGGIKLEKIKHGAYHPVEINRIVNDVYLSPGTKGWVIDLIKSILKKYGFSEVAIHKSEIDKEPPY